MFYIYLIARSQAARLLWSRCKPLKAGSR